MNVIIETFDVSKFVKSNDVKFEQEENIAFIFVTNDVSKLDIFKNFNEVQLANIKDIKVTFDVLKFDKSNDVKFEHK